MASNQTMFLNTNIIQCGLGTLTYTVPATLNTPSGPLSVSNVVFNVQCQATVPMAVAPGNGAGAQSDGGYGVTGTSPAYLPTYKTTGAQQGLGNGALGQGQQNSTPSGSFGGFDAGSSGGGANGPVSDNAVSPPPTYSGVASQLVITVKQNGTTVFTAPTMEPTQSSLQFKCPLLCNANDVITVNLTSSAAPDLQLNTIQANVSIGTGS
jgi:hypothetical protein